MISSKERLYMLFILPQNRGKENTAAWSHCQLFWLISICMLRWGTDIYRVDVGLDNTTQGIIFLPICVRAPKDDTRAAQKKQVSVKPRSEYRPKYHSADKIAVVLSMISYKSKCIFYQWMSKIGENQSFWIMKTLASIIQNISSFLPESRR